MTRYEDRARRIRELFEDEKNGVLSCGVMTMVREKEESCNFCDSLYLCQKVFDEEAEGGG